MAIDLNKYKLESNLDKYKIGKAAPEKPKGVVDTVLGGAQKVSDFFGGEGVTDFIGGSIAKGIVGPEAAKFVQMPTGKEVAGSALQLGSLAIPVGAAAKGASLGLKAAGLGSKAARVGGAVAAGAGTGYALDVGSKLQQNKTTGEALTPGIGTAVGGAIPLAGPALKGGAKLASETLGATTGVGGGVTRQMFKSARAGGDEATTALDALRGRKTPESIVEDARGALGTVIGNRTKAYQSELAKLKTNTKTFDHTPVVTKFNKMLEEFGVSANPDGTPNFLRSPGLGRYEKDLTQLSKVLREWGSQPDDLTVVGIDKLKQVIDDFRIGSADSRKFDSFITALRNEAKNLVKNEPGYDKLLKEYEESTGLIKEIQRGLSLGDKAQTDTAFRKLAGALRTNNEFRKQLVEELDAVAKGAPLSAQIAGQQMSELLPRGLARVAAGGGAVAGGIGAVGFVPLLKAALLTSPRVVGELLFALGYTARQADKIKKVLKGGSVFPGDILLNKLTNSPQKL